MKPLIKNTIIFKAEIPVDPSDLHNHLAEKSFTELEHGQRISVGFVPPGEGCSLVRTFHGGLAFRVRMDEKRVPGSVLKREFEKACAKYQEQHGRSIKGKARKELKEFLHAELLLKAFTTTTTAFCFYDTARGYLIIAGNKGIADAAVSQLIHAVGAVKTSTLHVSDVKGGLTVRLDNWLKSHGDTDVFGRFYPRGEAQLINAEKHKVSVKMGELNVARDGLHEAMKKGFGVAALGLTHNGRTEFTLTDAFRIKSLAYAHEPVTDEDAFAAEASLEVAAIAELLDDLLEMLGKVPPAEDPPVNPEDAEEAGLCV